MHPAGLPKLVPTSALALLASVAGPTTSAAQDVAIHELTDQAIVMHVAPLGSPRSVAICRPAISRPR